MKFGFYPKMAWSGIRKNRRLYLPYLLTCVGMVMMFYIVSFLSISPMLRNIEGGETVQSMLQFGCGVIGVFALLFLFYTNSFLLRRRKKEFGLYNILGMGKWNIARVLFWESLIIAAIALTGGLAAGIAFSKLAELGMLNILHAEVSFSLTLMPGAILQTLELFAIIFLLLLLNSLRQIHFSNPIALLRSENVGEKPPKANWFLALLGVLLLVAAYVLAVRIEDPVEALVWFFVAVIMVIIATYLLFITGSVAVCRILQKKKNYYYQTNHFVSVSSMAYRMKRTGSGLASICILCTMVLVIVSSTVCLYFGAEDVLRNRYPRNINLDTTLTGEQQPDSEVIETLRSLAGQTLQTYDAAPENVLDYRIAEVAAYMKDGRISLDDPGIQSFSNIWQIFFVPLEDYNRLMGQSETLEPNEALIYTTKSSFEEDTLVFENLEMKIKKTVPGFVENGLDAMQVVPSMFIFVPDFYRTLNACTDWTDEEIALHWFYEFDLDTSDEVQMQIRDQIAEDTGKFDFSVVCTSVAAERASFYGMFGGLFFLGILLGVVFIFAAVLIMYYKQISEGYEDQARFEIMQKVGMTKRDIRKSVNSQILTVFFLPLLTAGLHLTFAFPMIRRLLLMFALNNVKLLTLTTIGCFLVFALSYVLVYRVTSKAYCSIVSGAKRAERRKAS